VKWLRHEPYSLTPSTISGMEQLSHEFGADQLASACRAFRDSLSADSASPLLPRVCALEERQRSLERSFSEEIERSDSRRSQSGMSEEAVAQLVKKNQAQLSSRIETLEGLVRKLAPRGSTASSATVAARNISMARTATATGALT
jgi:hypothetical protein